MITMIVHVQVPPENALEYEKLLTHVTEMTLTHEPGVPYYAWAKSSDKPDTYVVIEVYRDDQAHAQHMASEWVKESIPITSKLIKGKFDIRQYVTPDQKPITLRHG